MATAGVRARALFFAALLPVGLGLTATAREPEFRLLPPEFRGKALSGDGHVVVGEDNQLVYPRATRLVLSTGEYQILKQLESICEFTNGDGSIVFGNSQRWTQATGWTRPPISVRAVSPDGLIMAGSSGGSFALLTSAGITILRDAGGNPINGGASAISDDGRAVAGGSCSRWGVDDAIHWTDPSAGGTVHWLGELPTGEHRTWAVDMSADGSVVVGHYYADSSHRRAFRWTNPSTGGGGVVALGFLPGGSDAVVKATDAGGQVVLGSDVGLKQPFIWSPGAGTVHAARWLADRGVQEALLADITDVLDISADGRTLVGTMRETAPARTRTWIATIDSIYCPIDFDQDWVVDFADFLQFLNLFGDADPRADLDRDGVVDFTDYLEFLNLYEAGC